MKKEMKKKEKEGLFSTKTLTIVFVCMFTFVIVLGGFLVNRKLNEDPNANMLIAILEKEKRYSFHINASALAEEEDYLLKVVNYRGDTISQEDVNYSITFSNPTDCKISVKKIENKKEEKEELMKDQESTKVSEQKLEKSEKNEIWYKISVVKKGNLKNNDLIGVSIES